jgi:hypothetical protein
MRRQPRKENAPDASRSISRSIAVTQLFADFLGARSTGESNG